MSGLKEYIVTLHNREDLDSFYEDMETPGGNLYIPDRAVDVANRRAISRNTHYWLTEEEAKQIKDDPRVLDVDLTVEGRGTEIVPIWTQTGDFTKFSDNTKMSSSNSKNWGLLRTLDGAKRTGWGTGGTISTTISQPLSGKNVDVVIVDGLITKPNHAEFKTNPDGTGVSRVNQFNWLSLRPTIEPAYPAGTYQYVSTSPSNSDHGHHVAATVAGNTQGWARDATIYNISPFPDNSNGISINQIYDYIRAWHNSKPINPATGRRDPTIVNNSWAATDIIDVESVNVFDTKYFYRGVQYNKPATPSDISGVPWTSLGFEKSFFQMRLSDGSLSGNRQFVSLKNTALLTDLDDALRDGIIIVFGAGNNTRKIDVPGGADWDNKFVLPSGAERHTNRHSVLNDFYGQLENTIIVGSYTGTTIIGIGSEPKSTFSVTGPGIDIWAPGSGIASAIGSLAPEGDVNDPRGLNGDRLASYDGTSMASPQVTGVLACLLELHPEWTPAQAKAYLTSKGKTGLIGTEFATTNSYTDVYSLQGADNLTLFSPIQTFSISSNRTTATSGQSITYTITTTNLDNGARLYLTEEGTSISSDFTSTLPTSITVNNNSATFTRTVSSSVSSGSSSIALRTGGAFGTIQATATQITLTGTSAGCTFTTTPTSINEGQSGSFAVSATNLAHNTTLYATINHISTNNFDFTTSPSLFSTSFVVSKPIVTWQYWSDQYGISVADGQYISSVLYTSNDLLGVYNTTPYYALYREPDTAGLAYWCSRWIALGRNIAAVKQEFALGASPTDPIDYPRVITNSKTFLSTNDGSEFYDGTYGDTSTGSFTITPRADSSTEGAQTFTVSVRTSSSTGTVIATSGVVTINDTSLGTPPTPVVPTYTFSSVPSSINEGSSGTFNVTTTNVSDSTVLYWSINHGTSAAADFSATSGSFLINGNTGSFVVSPSADLTTEGSQTFTISIRTGSTSGTVVATSSSVTINDTSTTPVVPSYTFSSVPTSINEGSSGTFNVTTTNVTNGTILYWTVKNSTTSNLDFDSASGSFSISGNAGSFVVSPSADLTTEGAQAFQIDLRTGSTSGTIVATSSSVTINDTSTTPVTPEYYFTSVPSSMTEGDYQTVSIITSNVPNGTTLHWTIKHGTTSAGDFFATSDSFVINANSGSFAIETIEDRLTEGSQNFEIEIRTGSTSGTVVATSSLVTINDTSVTVLTPTYSFTTYPASINEGSSGAFIVTTSNVPNNTTLYWTINFASTPDDVIIVSPDDFTSTSGSFTITNNTGAFSIPIAANNIFEGTESFNVEVRTSSTTGSVVLQGSSISIAEISTCTITSAPTTIAEGSTGNFQIRTTNVADNTTLYWTISHETSSAGDFSDVSGSFVVSNNNGAFSISVIDNPAGEGSETFTVRVRSGSLFGSILATSSTITITETETYQFTSIPVSINEKASATFELSTTNVLNNTRLYWTVLHNTTSSQDFVSDSGSFTITNNLGSFTLSTVADLTTEGNQTFRIQLRKGSTSGDIVATSNLITIIDTSTLPVYTLTGIPTSTSEGTTRTFGVNTTNLEDGTVLYWEVTGTANANLDFVNTSGSFTISGNVGTFSITTRADSTTEGSENFSILLRKDSPTGNVVATSSTIVLTDTSQTPYTLSASVGTIDEGSAVTINLLTSGLVNGSLVPYLIYGTGIDVGDFDGLTSLSGNFRITDNRASITLYPSLDKKTETNETFYLKLLNTGNDETVQITLLDTSKTSTNASFFITSPSNTIREGEVGRFNVRAINVQPGTVVPYRILGITQNDLTSEGLLEGSLTFASGAVSGETYANVALPVLEDFINEGSETILLLLEPEFPYTLEISSTIVVQDTSINVDPVYNLYSDKLTVLEGGNVVFTLDTVNIPDGTVIPWRIVPWETTTLTLGDFQNLTSFSGNFPPLSGNSTSINIFTRDDFLFELSEYFYLTIPNTFISSQVVRIIDSGNTLITTDNTYTGNVTIKFLDSAILTANLGSVSSGASYWADTTGLISENMVIQGKTLFGTEDALAFYHPFSYVIQSKVSIEEWRNSVKPLLHPAGLTIFSEINNETIPGEILNLEVKSVEETSISYADYATIDDTEIDASTTFYSGSNVRVDSLTFSFNL